MILFLINVHLWTSTFDVIFKIMITGFNNFSWNWRYWDRSVHTLWATSVLLNGLAKWHENILHWNSGAWEYRIRLQFYVEIILVAVLRPLAEFFGVSNFCLSFESFEMSFEMKKKFSTFDTLSLGAGRGTHEIITGPKRTHFKSALVILFIGRGTTTC